ncbi:MAG: hypothetical protein ACLFP2_01940 [Candidatus Woesearchaeota archaeon]
MKYNLLVRKLHTLDCKYITSEEIKEYCSILGITYKEGIVYLTRTKHLYRVLRGIFYKPDMEERKYKGLRVSHYEALAEAFRIKGVTNWYFGLETALKMNGLTHEFFAMDYVLTDTISRKRPMSILGNKVMFVKVKPKLFTFGINRDVIRYSDPEKTILDMLYLKSYRGERNIIDSLSDYIRDLSKPKLKKYAKYYNKKMEDLVSGL